MDNEIIKKALLSDSWFIRKNKAYFTTTFADCLWCADIENHEVTALSDVYNCETFRMHPVCFYSNEKLYWLPDKANDVVIFDLYGTELCRISIQKNRNVRLGMTSYYLVDDTAWIVSKGNATVYELDLKKDEIKNCYSLEHGKTIRASTIAGNTIYLLAANNSIYSFSISSRNIRLLDFEVASDDCLNTLCYAGDILWITGKKRQIYACNIETRRCEIIDQIPDSFFFRNETSGIDEGYLFSKSLVINGKVWFMHFTGNCDVYVDLEKKSVNCVIDENIESRFCDKSHSPLSTMIYVRDGKYIGKMVHSTSEVYEIDTDDMKFRINEYKPDTKLIKLITTKIVLKEKETYKLNDYISDINNLWGSSL